MRIKLPKSRKALVIISVPLLVGGLFFVLQNVSEYNTNEKNKIVDASQESVEPLYEQLFFTEDAQSHQVIVMSMKGEIIKRIPVGKEPHDIAVSPDQRYLATGNFGDGTVSIIDTTKLSKIIPDIYTGQGAHGVAFSPDGKYLFVANVKEDTLSIIDVATFIKQRDIKVGNSPEYVGVTLDGLRVFTTNLGGDGSVTILEKGNSELRVVKTISSGIDPHGWALSPDGNRVVITNLGSNFIYLFNSSTFEEISHIDTDSATEFAAFKDASELWVTNIGAHYVSVIDTDSNTILDQIQVGETPHGISFSSDRKLAFIPLYEPGEVVIIDVINRSIINRVKVGNHLHNSVVIDFRI